MFWPAFAGGCGVGAVAMIFLMVMLSALFERGTPPVDDVYDADGEP